MDCYLIRAPSTAQLILKLLRWTSRAQLCSTREKQKKSNNVLPPSRHRAVFCSSQNHGTQYNVNWRSIRLSWKRVLHGGQCSRRRLPAHISFSLSLSLTFNLSSSMSLFRSCLFNWVFFFPMETVCYLKHHVDNIHEGSSYILYVRQPDGEKNGLTFCKKWKTE